MDGTCRKLKIWEESDQFHLEKNNVERVRTTKKGEKKL